MPNKFFRFKEFTVYQDQCAMKVCTDACLFGALIDSKDVQHLLDIGTGTGLLSLMLAQRSTAMITAIEVDAQAATQAADNFKLSPWAGRLNVINDDVISWSLSTQAGVYDIIVCNPPFFQNSLPSPDQQKKVARHNQSLPLPDLASAIHRLLSDDGKFMTLLPPSASIILAESLRTLGICQTGEIKIKNYAHTPVFRVIHTYERHQRLFEEKQIIIYEAQQVYTDLFKLYLKPYYLYL